MVTLTYESARSRAAAHPYALTGLASRDKIGALPPEPEGHCMYPSAHNSHWIRPAVMFWGLVVVACVPSTHWKSAPTPTPKTAMVGVATAASATPTRPGISAVTAPTRIIASASGELRIAVREDITTLNPFEANNEGESLAVSLLYDTLLETDSDGKPRPNLAQRCETTALGTGLSCWLDPQAHWHDGRPVTAEDVVTSFYLLRQARASQMAWLASLCDRVEAINEHEVRFSLLSAQASAITALPTNLIIVPAHVWSEVPQREDAKDNSLVGSGPFQLSEWIPGDRLVLHNTQSHHNTQAGVATVVLRVLRDEVKALEELRTGNVDALGWAITPSLAKDIQAQPDGYPGLEVLATPGLEMHILLLNLPSPPYDQPAFRKALAKAIDTDAIVETAWGKFADPAHGAPFPRGSYWYRAAVVPISFDPELARQELQSAGYLDHNRDGWIEHLDGSRLQIRIACKDTLSTRHVAQRIAADWQAIGLSVEVDAIDQDQWIPTLAAGEFECALHKTGFADIRSVLASFAIDRGTRAAGRTVGPNFGGYSSPEANELILSARHEPDTAAELELIHRLQDTLERDVPQIPLYSPHILNLVRSDTFGSWQPQAGIGLLHRTTIVAVQPYSGRPD